MGRSIASLPPEQRIAHYREMAAEAADVAGNLHSVDMQAQILQLAESWLALASELERTTVGLASKAHDEPDAAETSLIDYSTH